MILPKHAFRGVLELHDILKVCLEVDVELHDIGKVCLRRRPGTLRYCQSMSWYDLRQPPFSQPAASGEAMILRKYVLRRPSFDQLLQLQEVSRTLLGN